MASDQAIFPGSNFQVLKATFWNMGCIGLGIGRVFTSESVPTYLVGTISL